MAIRIVLLVVALTCASPGFAQEKRQVDKAADLPRFSYKVAGKVEDLVRDAARFNSFAQEMRRDTESVLRSYEIADKAIQRTLLTVIERLEMLEGRYDAALRVADQIRALEEKPGDKLLSGTPLRAIVAARQAVGNTTSDVYRAEVAKGIAADLRPMPYAVIENAIKSAKTRAETLSEALILGHVREVLQPTVDKTGSLSSHLAPEIVNARFAITYLLPLKETLIATYRAYLAGHRIEKPDIWTARSVSLPAARDRTPVPIAVWDSGVELALFRDRLVLDPQGIPATIAFDKYGNPAIGELMPIPDELKSELPRMKSLLTGFADLQASVDSPEASYVKQLLSTLTLEEYKPAIEQLNLARKYVHGTHVAGIAMAGNPNARLMNARIEFSHTLMPEPCPSRDLANKDARTVQATIDHMKKYRVRVVNMSWSGDVQSIEENLEKCGLGKMLAERKAIAREYFEVGKDALTRAMASAPEILFVAAAGNSNQNVSFVENVPAEIVLPNLITVGAVDKAGDEAPFTSYGPTVVAHANGYLVESVIPGGGKLSGSGTSMAAPQVTNLAAKMLAMNPSLTPAEVIAIIRETADRTTDGRRYLIHPRKAVAAAEAKKR